MLTFTPSTPDDLDALWQEMLALIPLDVDQAAFDTRTIMRKREIRSGDDLLRLCFAYSLGLSLRQVAAWAQTAEIATLGDTSLRDRFKLCGFWLARLLATTLTADMPPVAQPQPWRVRLVDATGVARPTATGTDWRVHLSLDLTRQVFDQVTLTDAQGGEHLNRFTVAPQDLFIVDRGYGTRTNIAHVATRGADLIVRINWQNLPLQHRDGRAFALLAALRTLAPGQQGAWDVQTGATRQLAAITGRLIAVRLPPEQAAQARQAAVKRGTKHGRTPDPRTLEAAEYLIVFTTLAATAASPALVLALYRLRWQIEIAIKRLKSDLHLDALHAHDPALCETYLLASLLLAVLLDRLRERCLAFSPSGPAPALVFASADADVA